MVHSQREDVFLRAQLQEVDADQRIAALQVKRRLGLLARDAIHFRLLSFRVQRAQIGEGHGHAHGFHGHLHRFVIPNAEG